MIGLGVGLVALCPELAAEDEKKVTIGGGWGLVGDSRPGVGHRGPAQGWPTTLAAPQAYRAPAFIL